jgi:hypothetical protein
MIGKKLLLASMLGAFVFGAAGGLAIGHRAGSAAILNEALAKDARDVVARIAILGHVRSGEQKPAIEKLETGLDDLLIGFDPQPPYQGLEGSTVAALRKAIDEAKAYRAKHPWGEQKNMRADMVRSLFSRDLYR